MSESFPNPEQHETEPIVRGLVIPQDPQAPTRGVELPLHGLEAKQALVGGYIEAIDFTDPPASLYIHDEGKLFGSELNLRATTLLWMHNPAFRHQDYIVGDAFILGPPNRQGDDTDAPAQLAAVLQTADCTAKVKVEGSDDWHELAGSFESWYEAYAVALTDPLIRSIHLTPIRQEAPNPLNPEYRYSPDTQARDQVLRHMAVEGWANSRSGAYTFDKGAFAHISNDPNMATSIRDAFGMEMAEHQVTDEAITGHFILTVKPEEDGALAVAVETYPTEDTAARAFNDRHEEYLLWMAGGGQA